MKNTLLYILITFTTLVFSQISGIVINSNTKETISYVNIWIENENIGTTTNEKGEFILHINDASKTIILSAIGYETKKIKLKGINKIIELNPKTTNLDEVEIISKKETLEINIDKFKKLKNDVWFSNGSKSPWIVAKFFSYKESYKKTQFLKTIKVLTKSRVKNAKFNVRLYTIGNNGKPKEYINKDNIIGVAKKGKNITSIDISKLNIKFPKEGFFIAIERLIIESNKFEYTYTMNKSRKKHQGTRYEPMIGTLLTEKNENSWTFRNGKWSEIYQNKYQARKKYLNKYNLITVALVLSN